MAFIVIRRVAPRRRPGAVPDGRRPHRTRVRDDLPALGRAGGRASNVGGGWIGCVLRHAPARPRSSTARRVHVHDRAVGHRSCCCCRSSPASVARSTALACGSPSVRSGSSPPRSRRCSSSIFLASYLNAKKELLQVATARIGPLRLPAAKHLAPVLVAWATSLAVLFLQRDLGASLLYFGIFVVMLWVATGRAAYVVIGAILFVVGGVARLPRVRPRATPRRRLVTRARSEEGVRAGVRAGRPGAVRHGDRRAGRDRARRGLPGSSRSHRPTSSSRRSARSSGCSARPHCS